MGARQAGIKIQGRKHRLQRGGQQGVLPASTGLLFAPPETQEIPQIDLPRQAGQAALAHQTRAHLRQLALVAVGIAFVQVGRQNQPQDGIPQELQGLVIPCILGGLGGVGTMRQRPVEPPGVRKAIPQPLLQQGQAFGRLGSHHTGPAYCLKITHALVPPKPRELDIAAPTGMVRAASGT